MSCEAVRDHLTDYLLGTAGEGESLEIRRHLRACASCRRELATLGEGVVTLARATHDVAPPEELKARVLSVLTEEWAERPRERTRVRRFRPMWVGAAAVLAAALAWGAVTTSRVAQVSEEAAKYESLLEALDGDDVRVGTLRAAGTRTVEGSFVLYDSEEAQSWVLVLVRAPGMEGEARVVLSSPTRTIELHPVEFEPGGEGSTWLVTSANLRPFDRVRLIDQDGRLIASGVVQED